MAQLGTLPSHESLSASELPALPPLPPNPAAGFQGGGCIKVYDATSPCFTVLKYIHARQLRWTITDTALSPDSRFLLYSSITSTVHMVDISARGVGPDAARSIGNVTDLHEALELTGARGDVDDYSTGVWSLRWSPSGEEVAAGTADCSLYIYDIAAVRACCLERVGGCEPGPGAWPSWRIVPGRVVPRCKVPDHAPSRPSFPWPPTPPRHSRPGSNGGAKQGPQRPRERGGVCR